MIYHPVVGKQYVLSEEALENYGERFRGVVVIVDSISDHHVPASEFFNNTSPRYHEAGGHPGYDEGVSPSLLMDVDGEDFHQAVYDWELDEIGDVS